LKQQSDQSAPQIIFQGGHHVESLCDLANFVAVRVPCNRTGKPSSRSSHNIKLVHIPAEAVHQVNPVKPTSESLAMGKKYYGYDCAMCHGNNGDGKGEVALSEKFKIGDFTDPTTLKGRTDGELFYIIKNGRGQMPPEGDRVKPTELWNMVNYIRSLSNKKGQ